MRVSKCSNFLLFSQIWLDLGTAQKRESSGVPQRRGEEGGAEERKERREEREKGRLYRNRKGVIKKEVF